MNSSGESLYPCRKKQFIKSPAEKYLTSTLSLPLEVADFNPPPPPAEIWKPFSSSKRKVLEKIHTRVCDEAIN